MVVLTRSSAGLSVRSLTRWSRGSAAEGEGNPRPARREARAVGLLRCLGMVIRQQLLAQHLGHQELERRQVLHKAASIPSNRSTMRSSKVWCKDAHVWLLAKDSTEALDLKLAHAWLGLTGSLMSLGPGESGSCFWGEGKKPQRQDHGHPLQQPTALTTAQSLTLVACRPGCRRRGGEPWTATLHVPGHGRQGQGQGRRAPGAG